VSGARGLVESYFRTDYDDDDWRGGSVASDFSEIDLIFDRQFERARKE
jgi:hypothetical protein